MAKRFTDTEKWKKKWIRNLSLEHKLFWMYLLDDCNHAGIWDVDMDVANIRLGTKLDEETILEEFSEKIASLDDGRKWFIPKFIEFQYDGELNPDNRAHASVIKHLKSQGIDYSQFKREYFKKVSHHVPDKLRKEIYSNFNYICVYCNQKFEFEDLCVDHIVARAKGGTNEKSNLITSCKECNKKKCDFSLNKFIKRYNLDEIRILGTITKIRGLISPINAPNIGCKDKDKDKDMVKDKNISGFEMVWSKYPRRVGKKMAKKHFEASVKTVDDLKRLDQALANYLDSKRVLGGFIQNGSTWFNNWQDWIDYEEKVCPKCKDKGKFTSKTGYEIICDCPAGK